MGKHYVKSKSKQRLLKAEQLTFKAKQRLKKAKRMMRKSKQMIRKAKQKLVLTSKAKQVIKCSPPLTPVLLKIIFYHNTKRSSFRVNYKRWGIFSLICKHWYSWMKIRNPIPIYGSPLDILHQKAKKCVGIRTYNNYIHTLSSTPFITVLYKKQTIQAKDLKLRKEKKQFNVKYGGKLGFRLTCKTNKPKQ